MTRRFSYPIIILAAGFLIGCASTVRAESEPEQGHGQHGWRGGGNRVQFILKHGDELTLNDEQKTKLEALAKESEGAAAGPDAAAAQKQKFDAILTQAQRDKLSELFRARKAERTAGSGKDPADLPVAAPPPPVPHIEDKVRGADLLTFILSHDTELFLRADQKEQFQPLAKSGDADTAMKKTIWDILTGQQIGKLREMLKEHPELQKLGLAPAPAPGK